MRFTLELNGFRPSWRLGAWTFYRYDDCGFGVMVRGCALCLGPLFIEIAFKAK